MSELERDAEIEKWDHAYRRADAPWDIGGPQPALVRVADAGSIRGLVLDAGCGSGDNALELAGRGLDVVGIDWSPRAIEIARAKAEARGISVRFEVADALRLDTLGLTFDSVVDCGLFHTFPPDGRSGYVDSLGSVLRSGGLLVLLCFSDLEPWDGGPWRISQDELRQSFADGWTIRSVIAERFATTLHQDGALAWLATIERG